MAKQTFTTGQVLTAAQMTSLQQTAMGGGTASTKTASYTLVAADAGTVIQMNSASATTITVNTALFSAGDTVQIQNIGAGVCTVTAGTATVSTAGSLALSQWEGGQLYFTSTSASIFFDIVQGGAAFSGVSLYLSANQSFASGSGVNMTFNTELFDTDGFHDTATNTDRITIPSGKAGYYLLSARTIWAASASGIRIGLIRKNAAATQLARAASNNQTAASETTMLATCVVNLAVADYVVWENYQDGVGALNATGNGQQYSAFSAIYLGA
jgi:hypothetical protein